MDEAAGATGAADPFRDRILCSAKHSEVAPMAKKRGGGGSSQALIIVLVFFILTTIGLGVATYYGFAEQEKLTKEAKDSQKSEKAFKEERDWYKFQALLYRAYIGQLPQGANAEALKELAANKVNLEKGSLSFATGQKDKDEVTAFFQTLDQAMPGDASQYDQPGSTYEKRLKRAQDQTTALENRATDLERQRVAAEQGKKEAEDLAAAEKKKYSELLQAGTRTNEENRTTDRGTITTLQKDLAAQAAKTEKEKQARETLEKTMAAVQKKMQRVENELTNERKELKETRDERDDVRSKYTALAEKAGVDLKAVEAQALDASARKVLETWKKDWKIVELDRRGETAYVNLGWADRVVPQLTFSIHGVGPDGRLSPNAKGTLEIVKVTGAHLAQARITSHRRFEKGEKTDSTLWKNYSPDPILKGDKLFNPTWDPDRKKHVAVAGFIDLVGDGKDGSDDFRRMLTRQGAVVDAW